MTAVAERPTPSSGTSPNYELHCSFGEYGPGDIVPGYVVEVGHDYQALIEKGLFEPTNRTVNVKVAAPRVPDKATPDSVYDERNRLAAEVKGLREAAEGLSAANKALERDKVALTSQLGTHVADAAHLKAACEDHQSKVEQLEKRVAELEAERAKLLDEVSRAKSKPGKP
jgi:DNA repair exonuclease SbcCD ATPase subunit